MKATGIVRKLDGLGRVVIPSELRRVLEIYENDMLEIYMQDEGIVLQKYTPKKSCVVTGVKSEDNVKLLGGNLILSPEVVDQLTRELQGLSKIDKIS